MFWEKLTIPFARFALATIYFWFGALKVLETSPANPLVAALLAKTLPSITFEQFIFILGAWEMVIGLAFLIPRYNRLALALLIPHLVVVFAPLLLLPALVWQKTLTPTLEGQYIIKNLLIVALAIMFAARRPWRAN